MNWFEAFQHVNAEIMATNDDELIDAWGIFLRSPFPHLQIPPAPHGVPAGRVQRLAENFLETAGQWQGKGVELLLFRLAQAVEGLLVAGAGGGLLVCRRCGMAGRLGEQCAGCGDFLNAAAPLRVNGRSPAGVGQGVPIDDTHQVSYCDGCGLPLHPDGGCLHCDG